MTVQGGCRAPLNIQREPARTKPEPRWKQRRAANARDTRAGDPDEREEARWGAWRV
jgi:hypothetical protein